MISLKIKYRAATVIAIVFHVIGIVGMLFFDRSFFIKASAVNLLLMFTLLLFTQKKINLPFIIFFVTCFAVGFVVEVIGINSGMLFGEYAYGSVLGPLYRGVPWIIGLNWFIIIFCCGVTVHMLLEKLSGKLSEMTGAPSPSIKFFSILTDGAILALFFDWVMEPAAVKLGYWQWLGDGNIPFYNYVSWFVISALLMAVFSLFKFDKNNVFAVNLLMIMLMFFMLIRTFL